MPINHRRGVPVLVVAALGSGAGTPAAEEHRAYASHGQMHATGTDGRLLVRACTAVGMRNCRVTHGTE